MKCMHQQRLYGGKMIAKLDTTHDTRIPLNRRRLAFARPNLPVASHVLTLSEIATWKSRGNMMKQKTRNTGSPLWFWEHLL